MVDCGQAHAGRRGQKPAFDPRPPLPPSRFPKNHLGVWLDFFWKGRWEMLEAFGWLFLAFGVLAVVAWFLDWGRRKLSGDIRQ